MKLLSLVTGFLLISAVIIFTGWYVVGSNALTITKVECTLAGETCSTQLSEKIEAQLVGGSFFITDFSQAIKLENIAVRSFSKKFPGKLHLEVQASQNQFAEATFIATDSNEDIIKFITTYFDDEKLPIQDIRVFQDKDLVVATHNDQQLLLSIKNLEIDATKTSLILKNLDLDSIDLAIVEIDARYKLPVLRTNKTQF